MEENRLKPMVEGYDKKMFERLYKKTEGLRRKLASQINCHRFGLQYEDILSFFDSKFLYAFNKYCTKHNEQVLLGHLINSLSLFKCRILRAAYTNQYSQTILSEDSLVEYKDSLIEPHPMEQTKDYHYNALMDFMKKHLSQNAYAVFEIQLNPPPYILHKLNTDIDSNLQKIPDQIILDYFELGNSNKAYSFLNSLKKEIRLAVNYAKQHFKNN